MDALYTPLFSKLRTHKCPFSHPVHMWTLTPTN